MGKSTAPGTAHGFAAAADRLVVEPITDIVDVTRLTSEWSELLDATSVGAPFRSAAWLLTWWQQFGNAKALRFYAVSRGPCLVGLLPAYRVRTQVGGWQLRLLGDRIVSSDYLGLIVRTEDAQSVSEAVARALVRAEGDLVLEGVEAGDALLGALERAASEAGASSSREILTTCPFLAIEHAGEYPEWLARRPTRVGRRLAASQRWLARQPGVRFEVLSREADLVAAADAFWGLHHARWAPAGGSVVVYNAETAAFQATSMRALAAQGWARMYLLYVAGRACAALYGFEHGRHFAYYQGGFDPNLRHRSLGMVVLNAALRNGFDHRMVDFDFLRGNESYKQVYANGSRTLMRIHVASGARGRASLAAARTGAATRKVLRATLPVDLIRLIRRLERTARQWSPPTA